MVRICVHQLERRGLVRDSHPWPRKLNIELVMGGAGLWRLYFDLQITFPQLSILPNMYCGTARNVSCGKIGGRHL